MASLRRMTRGIDPWPAVFVGEPGAGKTCAALCVLDYTYGTARYETVKTLNTKLQVALDGIDDWGEEGLSQDRWWHYWQKAAVCCVDEIGTRHTPSDAEYDNLKQAIDIREGRPLILITNVTDVVDLGAVYDERFVSRLLAGTIIDFGNVDRRIRK